MDHQQYKNGWKQILDAATVDNKPCSEILNMFYQYEADKMRMDPEFFKKL